MGWASYEHAWMCRGPSLRFDETPGNGAGERERERERERARARERARRSMPPYPIAEGADQVSTLPLGQETGEALFWRQREKWRAPAKPAGRPHPRNNVKQQREMARAVASVRSPRASTSSGASRNAFSWTEGRLLGVQLAYVVEWLRFNGPPGQLPRFESDTSESEEEEEETDPLPDTNAGEEATASSEEGVKEEAEGVKEEAEAPAQELGEGAGEKDEDEDGGQGFGGGWDPPEALGMIY